MGDGFETLWSEAIKSNVVVVLPALAGSFLDPTPRLLAVD